MKKESKTAETALLVRRPPRRYLTYDVIESFRVLGKLTKVRIRIWQGCHLAAIVLVSQVDGQQSARPAMTWIANYINESYLRFQEDGMLLFDDSDIYHVRFLHQHVFETFGHFDRARFCKPQQYVKSWDFFPFLVEDSQLQR